jgi:hypothetical protein
MALSSEATTTLREMGCPFVAAGINLFDYLII